MSDRYVCTKDAPWEVSKNSQSIHPDAVRIEEADDTAFSEGNKDKFHCPNCGLDFSVTQPDY